MKNIVFFDIDGTIYQYNYGIPEDTKSAIRSLREKGNLAFICTGRTKSMIFPEILDIGFDGIVAGAGTYLEIGDEVIYNMELAPGDAKDIIDNMKKNKIMAIAEGKNNIYFDLSIMPEKYKKVYNLYKEKVGNNVVDSVDGYVKVSKISGIALSGNGPEVMEEIYRGKYKVVYHMDDFIEMIPMNVSKAYGIEKTIDILGIDIENTYAFGDGMNDYEMLKYVKNGIAMGNAHKEFKTLIGRVTGDFDKGGISDALKGFGLI